MLQRSGSPLRQIQLYLGITYFLALAIAIALPHAGIAQLISILFPTIAVALTIRLTTPAGHRRAVWSTVGFRRPSVSSLVISIAGPTAISVLSFAVATAFGVVRFPGFGSGFWSQLGEVLLATVIFGVIFLGEEIGWRGYLLLRLGELMSMRKAALVTGVFHAIFHLPLLLLSTTYQSDGKRWIVVPMVMVTLTLAGVWYGWLRLRSGSIWPVSLSHSAFNNIIDGIGKGAIATSPAAMAYVTTETGVATLVIVVIVSAYLLTQRAADFERPVVPVSRIDTARAEADG
jgi:membrane protease YdiL (CAAX protease family)